MHKYDFRFDESLIRSFVGKILKQYKCAEFLYTNSVTGILGIEIGDQVYGLINDYEPFDYMSLDDEATVFRFCKMNWIEIESMVNNDINVMNVNEKIKKIVLVNDHTILKNFHNVEYDMWDTKAIIFYFEEYELCFVKQDCWFSQEIEIYKGYNLLNKTGNGKGILSDFDESDLISVDRTFVEIG